MQARNTCNVAKKKNPFYESKQERAVRLYSRKIFLCKYLNDFCKTSTEDFVIDFYNGLLKMGEKRVGFTTVRFNDAMDIVDALKQTGIRIAKAGFLIYRIKCN